MKAARHVIASLLSVVILVGGTVLAAGANPYLKVFNRLDGQTGWAVTRLKTGDIYAWDLTKFTLGLVAGIPGTAAGFVMSLAESEDAWDLYGSLIYDNTLGRYRVFRVAKETVDNGVMGMETVDVLTPDSNSVEEGRPFLDNKVRNAEILHLLRLTFNVASTDCAWRYFEHNDRLLTQVQLLSDESVTRDKIENAIDYYTYRLYYDWASDSIEGWEVFSQVYEAYQQSGGRAGIPADLWQCDYVMDTTPQDPRYRTQN